MVEDSDRVAVQTEAMLLGWSESSARGRTVTFLLPEDQEEHPFKGYAIRSGKRAGQRFLMVLVEIGPNEQPVVQQQRKLSQTAAALCKQELFQRFADEHGFARVNDEASAREFILSGAGIKSRSELDTNPAAAEWFREQCLKPFLQYKSAVEDIL